MTVEDGAIVGGTSFPLTLTPAACRPRARGLPAPRLLRGARAVPRRPAASRGSSRPGRGGRLRRRRARSSRVTGVQIPGVLDDLYGGAARATSAPTWRHGRPRLPSGRRRPRTCTLLTRPSRPRRRCGGTATACGGRRAASRGAAPRYAFEVRVYAPTHRAGGDERRHRPVLARADHQLDALDPRRPRRPALDARAAGTGCASPRSTQPEDIDDLRAARARLLDHRRDGARRRTAAPTCAFTDAGSDGMRAPARARRRRADHAAPAAGLRHRDDPGEPGRPAGRRRATCRRSRRTPRSSRRASTRSRDRTASTGATTRCTTRRPEGSYATDPDGPARTREFREMVAGLNRAGLRVVMDVVYNHTTAAGQDPKSVLDRIVPGYYHRLTHRPARSRPPPAAPTPRPSTA